MKYEFAAQLSLSHEGSGVGAETEGMFLNLFLDQSIAGTVFCGSRIHSSFVFLPVAAKLHIRIQGGQEKPAKEKSSLDVLYRGLGITKMQFFI
jgi:hypothetical protein